MKLPWNKQYLTIAFHVIVTVVAIGAAMMIMAQLSQFAGVIQAGFFRLVHLFSPLLFAVVIAFLLNPLVGWMQRKVLRRPKPKEGFSGNLILLHRPHGGAPAVAAVVPVVPQDKIFLFPQHKRL